MTRIKSTKEIEKIKGGFNLRRTVKKRIRHDTASLDQRDPTRRLDQRDIVSSV
jgi:hypothetical protein